ncbi:MAG: hypothetical protein [Siphoviridae sp. ctpQM7]|nr:MAG: hypothetical protein [Siphoviridae sp. ctpQM7]
MNTTAQTEGGFSLLGHIPSQYHGRFTRLRPARKLIIILYFHARQSDPRSIIHLIPKIARTVGYSIDVNGSNTYIARVIRDFMQGGK